MKPRKCSAKGNKFQLKEMQGFMGKLYHLRWKIKDEEDIQKYQDT